MEKSKYNTKIMRKLISIDVRILKMYYQVQRANYKRNYYILHQAEYVIKSKITPNE